MINFRPPGRFPCARVRLLRSARAAPVRHATRAESRGRERPLESIAADILENENALKAAFQPGKPMPTGKEVAVMRNAAKNLRALLAERIAAEGQPAEGASKEIAALITSVAAQRARQSLSSMEEYMASSDSESEKADPSSLNEQEFVDLQLLQVENDDLRKRAGKLLTRQQYLEELMREHGIAAAGAPASPGGRPAPASAASLDSRDNGQPEKRADSDAPYFMTTDYSSTPSFH